MLNKSKKNQYFTFFDACSVITLLGFCLALISTIVRDALHDDRVERARSEAESLANQMATRGFGFIEEVGSFDRQDEQGPVQRSVASSAKLAARPGPVQNPTSPLSLFEGKLGKDPWGRAFHYKLLRSSEGVAMRILVWSDGPNRNSETRFAEFDAALSMPVPQVRFAGDDVGHVYQYRP